MKKKLYRFVEDKTLIKIKKGEYNRSSSAYVYYTFDAQVSTSQQIKELEEAVKKELADIQKKNPDIAVSPKMTTCKINPNQSERLAHVTMIKVMLPCDIIYHRRRKCFAL